MSPLGCTVMLTVAVAHAFSQQYHPVGHTRNHSSILNAQSIIVSRATASEYTISRNNNDDLTTTWEPQHHPKPNPQLQHSERSAYDSTSRSRQRVFNGNDNDDLATTWESIRTASMTCSFLVSPRRQLLMLLRSSASNEDVPCRTTFVTRNCE